MVTDLGTEFGVEVDRSGGTESHVFSGKVKVVATAENRDKCSEFVLGENESIQVVKSDVADHPAAIRRGRAKPEGFVRVEQLPQITKESKLKLFRRWQAYSQELRRDPSLMAYYDFQLREGRPALLVNVAESSKGSCDGVVENVTWSNGRMAGKHALQFNGPDDCVRVSLPHKVDDLTLAAWVYVESLDNGINSLFVSDSWSKPEQVAWQLWSDGHVEFGVHDWREPYFHSKPVFDRTRFYRWTHLALTYDRTAARVALYVDGQLLDEAHVPEHVPICIGSARIGQWNPGGSLPGQVRNFHGRIDELAIFGRVLKSDEIQRMFNAGRPEGAFSSLNAPRTISATDR